MSWAIKLVRLLKFNGWDMEKNKWLSPPTRMAQLLHFFFIFILFRDNTLISPNLKLWNGPIQITHKSLKSDLCTRYTRLSKARVCGFHLLMRVSLYTTDIRDTISKSLFFSMYFSLTVNTNMHCASVKRALLWALNFNLYLSHHHFFFKNDHYFFIITIMTLMCQIV